MFLCIFQYLFVIFRRQLFLEWTDSFNFFFGRNRFSSFDIVFVTTWLHGWKKHLEHKFCIHWMHIPQPFHFLHIICKLIRSFVSNPPPFNLIISFYIIYTFKTAQIFLSIIIQYFNLVENSSERHNKFFVSTFKTIFNVKDLLIMEILSSLFDHAN